MTMAQKPSAAKTSWSMLKRRYGFTGNKKVLIGLFGVLTAALLGVAAFSQVTHGSVIPRQPSEKAQTDARSEDAAQTNTEASSQLSSQSSESSETERKKKAPSVVVYVDGAVSAPGIYTLSQAPPRLNDALEAAGGPTDKADISELNLAALIKDGEKFHVPAKGEKQAFGQSSPSGTSGTSSEANAEPSLVNLNTADEKELMSLPGIGESMAQTIVKDRLKNGPFSTPEDLMRVSGIGEKKFERIKDYVCVS